MQLAKDIIVLILIGLIKIGDLVIYGARGIATAIRAIIALPLKAYNKIQNPLPRLSLPKVPAIHLPRFRTPSFLKKRFSFPARPKINLKRPHISLPIHKIRTDRTIYRARVHVPLFAKFKYFFAGWAFSAIFIFLPLLFVIFIQDLPSPQELILRPAPQTTKIYDRNGILLYQIYASQNRTIVPLSDIPLNLQHATIAIEDKDFYKHPGFDLAAIIRSFLSNISDRKLQGGSTLTQQLIKSALLSPEQNVTRKVKEIILAFWAERIYSKNQILELYFNQVAYGGTAYGAEAASEVYFGKHAKDLDLAESAFLAGLPQAPTIYSPFGSTPTLWKQRQKDVLNRMVALGYITSQQASEANKEELVFQTPQTPIYAPHFVMYIRDLLVKKYGLPLVERGGLNVVTSLDLKVHQNVQKIVSDEVNADAYLNLTNGAAVVTDPKNGDILAMVGSKDFSDPTGGNVNIATSLRQPGSSIKIVTYATALSNGMTPATLLDDSPTTFPGNPPYSPVNYDGKFRGRVPLRLAFANSLNIPAVKTLNQVGVPAMVANAKKMGIKSWGPADKYGLSLTLGSAEATMLEMATVYGVFANSGVRVDPNPILKITDYKGNILEEKRIGGNPFSVDAASDGIVTRGEKVLDEGVAFLVSSILSDNNARAMEFGTNSPLYIPGKTVPVKTGTSDNKRDNWTIGYTKDYVVTVWVGNNDNSPMSQQLASGITGAAPIWNKIMNSLINGKPDQPLTPPSDVVQKSCLGYSEYFLKGTENSVNCAPFKAATPTAKP